MISHWLSDPFVVLLAWVIAIIAIAYGWLAAWLRAYNRGEDAPHPER